MLGFLNTQIARSTSDSNERCDFANKKGGPQPALLVLFSLLTTY